MDEIDILHLTFKKNLTTIAQVCYVLHLMQGETITEDFIDDYLTRYQAQWPKG